MHNIEILIRNEMNKTILQIVDNFNYMKLFAAMNTILCTVCVLCGWICVQVFVCWIENDD